MAEEDGVTDLIKIVRFSKILDVDTSPIPSWIQSWSRAEQTKAFKDLIFAPITLDYSVSYLSLILESKEPGYYHVSGSEDVDYVTFAKFLAKSLDYPSNLVSETTSLEAGIEIPFLPKFSGLDNVVKSLSFKLTKL
jgi:dTDP-4-dehydrorhamnose reductase